MCKVLSEPKINEFDLSSFLLDYDILSLQIAEDNPLLMQVVEQDKSLSGKKLDKLKLDADLFALEIIKGNPLDRLHEEVDVLFTLERGIELREEGSYQVLFSSLLQMTQNVSLVEQVLNLLLLCQVVKFDHLECIVAGRCVQWQD